MSSLSGLVVTQAREEIDCAHCGLPVPAGLIEPEAHDQFCCHGCKTVYAVIHQSGLEDYYSIRERLADETRPARPSERSYGELDHEAFHRLYVRPLEGGLQQVELFLEGVHCAACVWLVEKVPLSIPGTVESRLDIGSSMVRVVWDPETTTLSEIARFIDSLGYPVHPVQGQEARLLRKKEDRALLIKIGVAGAVAGNVMLMAFALYSGLFGGMEREWFQFFRWGSLLVSLPAVFYSGNVFFRGAWSAVKTWTPHMDLPITIGILAGFGWGVINTVRGVGEIYFDSITALVFLLLVGRWLQRREQRSAADAAELLYALAPSTARVIAGDTIHEVPVEAIELGAQLEVRAGDTIPADGRVVSGRSAIDASVLTGESRPLEVSEGSSVHAGTVNLAARLVVEAEATGESTRVGRLMKMVEESARRRAPIVQLADRISGYFVVTVLSLAALTFAIWILVDPSVAVDRAVALLIVTCPCALGLATPLAVGAAIGKAARAGILIKGSDVIEKLARPGTIFFDKTGTLTEGKMSVVELAGDAEWHAIVARLEQESSHPIARAIAARFEADESLELSEVRQLHGGGIAATLPDGRRLAVGSASFACEGKSLPTWAEETIDAWARSAITPVVVSVDRVAMSLIGLADPVRADAASSLGQLAARGYAPSILSGDHVSVAEAVGRTLDVAARGEATPEAKLETVERAAKAGSVFMVGDGVNDAAALSAASVGIAVHGGAEASLAAADVFLTREGVAPVLGVFEGAKRTMQVIRLNLIFSLTYNLVGVVLAMTGAIGPLGAALLMPLSSLTVVTTSYRAKTFES